MPAVVIDLRHADDLRDVVHQTVQALAEGKIVAFPTETVYGLAASALDEQAVERLAAIKGRKQGHPLTLAIKSADEARDYVPDMSPLAQRLARRCWPGPVTLGCRRFPLPTASPGTCRARCSNMWLRARRSGFAFPVIKSCWTCCGCLSVPWP